MLRHHHTLILSSALAISTFALLAAGCGGSAGSASGTTTATTAATTPGTVATQYDSLAFARCLRAHGLTGWPDPTADGHFDKSKIRQIGYSVSQVRAVEDGPCKHVLPSNDRPAAPITAAERADYLNAAKCMRTHGFPGFPDPTFQGSNVRATIPASINQDAPVFRAAATTCTRLIPAGLPNSGSGTR